MPGLGQYLSPRTAVPVCGKRPARVCLPFDRHARSCQRLAANSHRGSGKSVVSKNSLGSLARLQSGFNLVYDTLEASQGVDHIVGARIQQFVACILQPYCMLTLRQCMPLFFR